MKDLNLQKERKAFDELEDATMYQKTPTLVTQQSQEQSSPTKAKHRPGR